MCIRVRVCVYVCTRACVHPRSHVSAYGRVRACVRVCHQGGGLVQSQCMSVPAAVVQRVVFQRKPTDERSVSVCVCVGVRYNTCEWYS